MTDRRCSECGKDYSSVFFEDKKCPICDAEIVKVEQKSFDQFG